MIHQQKIELPAFSRGFHIITDYITQALGALPEAGVLTLFIQHTSAGLTINENADPDVLVDFESVFNRLVPENMPFLKHTMEGADDMPAHIKAALVGASVTIPIAAGQLALGTWQGIFLCEFRNHGGHRKILATIIE